MEEMTRKAIGKFQIEKMIGRGGTASVYQAKDPFSGNKIAIKIAHQSTFKDPVNGTRSQKMFMNEASLAGKLHHPYIVTVYDAGIEDDLHYIAMEYVPGHTLKNYCKPKDLLPVSEVVEIIFKCCNALEYAHRNGVIHRDLKPANILTSNGKEIKISDFGAALRTDTELTQVIDAVGTPSYMSPEQIMGKELTQQSDIYSLGVVMYQLLSGKLPFTAENQFDLVQKITTQPPSPLKKARSDLPENIIKIVNRCLEKETIDRYFSCADLAKDLSRVNENLEQAPDLDESDSRKFGILKRMGFFNGFTDVELWEILRISKWRRFREAKTLLEEGQLGSSIFILADGTASIMKNDSFLGVIESGQCFGEMAYIHGMKKARTASVVSNSEVTIIKINTDALQHASDHLQMKFNKVLLKTLADRLEKTSVMATTL